ncbi:SDR family NAD(P)-dependent oxidoreductase [Paenibacillus sp. CAU 1782]
MPSLKYFIITGTSRGIGEAMAQQLMSKQHNKAEDIIENVTINLLAPMVTTSNFIKHTQGWATDKRIMNISSASAKFLLPSQSCYSTSKAGLDTFSKSIHLEQCGKDHPVRIVSVYPGMIDTALQAEIRTIDRAAFPYVDQFVQLAQEGKLQTPAATATQLIILLASEQFGDTPLIEEL